MMLTDNEMLLFHSLIKEELYAYKLSKEEDLPYIDLLETTMAKIKKSWDRKNKRSASWERARKKRLNQDQEEA